MFRIKTPPRTVAVTQELFHELVLLMTGRHWNEDIRRIVVWPAAASIKKMKPNDHYGVELFNYRIAGELATGGTVIFTKED